MKNLLFIAIAILGFTAVSFGQNSVTDAKATATIITPISLVKGLDMRFGSMAPSGTAGTVVLSTAGGRTSTNVQLQLTGAVAFGAATFTASGQSGSAYAITLPSSITLTSGTDNMTVSSLLAKSLTGTESNTATGTLTGGNETFSVGGTLAVSATQATGTYNGTYAVTVNYN